jgi:hypothetical protein
MKSTHLANALMLSSCLLFNNCTAGARTSNMEAGNEMPQQGNPDVDNTRVQVALLLDTSNSMDGLIDQAKSRLWNIINTLTTLKYRGKTPRVEIALYEYGNSGLPGEKNYIRQVAPMTTDLDFISEKLFALRTNGGDEYCGAVIQEAVRKLDWGGQSSDMKLVYIAGNEPFNQGRIHYSEAIASALSKGIFVNTIYCGDYGSGISELWKDGAQRGKGKYFNIDSDKKVRFITTPYDARIEACNEKINDTYISYGSMGASGKKNQSVQDANAASMSRANYAERAVSKSKAVYKNSSWDLVDKAEEDKDIVSNIDKKQLDMAYQNKTNAELQTIITEKARERARLQKEIQDLAKQRQAYIDAETKKSGSTDDLGVAINKSILDLAIAKGYAVSQ